MIFFNNFVYFLAYFGLERSFEGLKILSPYNKPLFNSKKTVICIKVPYQESK
jgi:hypothetical protein